MRAFVGIPVPEPLADRLAGALTGFDIGTHVPPENLHLTLAFLGEQTEAVLRDLHDCLGQITAEGFTLTLDGLGTFGDRRPRVLFAQVRPEAALSELRRKVRGAAAEAGIELPHERFVPHITLARFGQGLEGDDVARLQSLVARRMGMVAGSFDVEGFALYESILGRHGPVYEALAEYDLTIG